MGKDKREMKVDLTLVKRLVAELETALASADNIRANKTEENILDYVVEMSKCTGLAAGIMQEATLLMGDIQKVTNHHTLPKEDILSSLLGAIKGGGSLPGAN
jgi:hypothetical protein